MFMPIRYKRVKHVLERAAKGEYYTGVSRKIKFGRAFDYQLIVRAFWPDPDDIGKILSDITRTKVVTPNYLAQKYNIRVSTARRILEWLREKGIVELSPASSSQVKIYIVNQAKIKALKASKKASS